jgi:hypothetical protein
LIAHSPHFIVTPKQDRTQANLLRTTPATNPLHGLGFAELCFISTSREPMAPP